MIKGLAIAPFSVSHRFAFRRGGKRPRWLHLAPATPRRATLTEILCRSQQKAASIDYVS
jgi:hypothetical protein